PYLTREAAERLGVESVELDELLTRADFVTIHTPLTGDTRHLLGEAELERLKPGARIINCARGGLIDELALARAIQAGKVAGASASCATGACRRYGPRPPARSPGDRRRPSPWRSSAVFSARSSPST